MVRLDTPPRRLALVVLLVGVQIGLFVHYGHQQQQCPNVECYASDYEGAVGETVRVGGPIVETDPTTVAVEYGVDRSLKLVLTGTTVTPERGTLVSVYGTLQPDHRLAVTEIVVKPPGDRRYMFAVSILGILLVCALGLRYWHVDPKRLIVRRRGET